MIRLFVVVMSANLALLVLFTDLFNPNADLKGMRGGGCYVEVEHNCINANGICELGNFPQGHNCSNRIVNLNSVWYSSANATTTGLDFMFESELFCLASYDCEEQNSLGNIYCSEGDFIRNFNPHTNQDVDGEPCSVGS